MRQHSMRALVFERPAPDTSASNIADLPVPSPGAGEVAIAVEFAGINFKDVMARRGDAGYVTSWPFVPGLEVSGTVRAVGDGVETFEIGQRVLALTNDGGLAEVAVARAALTTPVPDEVELVYAAAVPGAFTTATLLLDESARARAGDTMLVHSASGSVGRALAEIARLRGVRLIGSVGAQSRTAAASDAGYDLVVVRGDSLAAQVRESLEGRGVDVVLDPLGTAWLEQDLAALAPGGRVVLFGNAGGGDLDPLPPAGRLYGANASIGGFSLAALSAAAPEVVAHTMTKVLEHLAAGDLALDIIDVAGLANAPAAQQALADGTGTGKQIVRIGSQHGDPAHGVATTHLTPAARPMRRSSVTNGPTVNPAKAT